ncbi:putative endonuclease [Monaibacterium marinum]|uniref:UPF0102 protein SAMN06273572_101773 n=1 Tax=Pontivivens marinum TaxID=1690039 RepID=A0A2C9CNW8_9RHOB|nr:YraN family protein [Monaibacterium marinum]SOH92922.1 putative endonuclease [Monaibacterium marinum]
MSQNPRQLDFLPELTAPTDSASHAHAARPPAKSARQRRGAIAYETGHLAEEAALQAYLARGARLLHQRYRVREGEIDLIFWLNEQIVFCEVKSRRTIDEAAHSITPRQWQRLERAANRYMMENNVGATTDMRFDAVLMDRTGQMQVVENAHLFLR